MLGRGGSANTRQEVALADAAIERVVDTVDRLVGRVQEHAELTPLAFDQDRLSLGDISNDRRVQNRTLLTVNDEIAGVRDKTFLIPVLPQDQLDIGAGQEEAASSEYPPVAV